MQAENLNVAVERAVAGDREVLVELLLNYSASLEAHVTRHFPAVLRGHLGVDDILQDTFLQVFRLIGHFEPRHDGSFLAWLKALADNQVRNATRAFARQKRGGGIRRVQNAAMTSSGRRTALLDQLVDDVTTPSSRAARREATRALDVGIASLPQDQRAALHLRYVEGRTLDEAALEMDRSPAAVRGLVFRAKEALRATLGKSSRWFSKK
jgi:RNA polymerase sigma-70 factor (ECF subfamily)